MTKQLTNTRRELANRSNNGLVDVTLVWSRINGIHQLTVCVSDLREGAYFEISAEPAHALDVFYHPFAYLQSNDLEREDSRFAA